MKRESMKILSYIALVCLIIPLINQSFVKADEINKFGHHMILSKESYTKFTHIKLPGIEIDEKVWPINLKLAKIVQKRELKSKSYGRVKGYQVIYDDGTKIEVAFRPDGKIGTEIYQKGNWSYAQMAKYSDVPKDKNASLVGIRIQYFPDCSDDMGFSGKYPAMVIYVFQDGKNHQLGFFPNGKLRTDFWYDSKQTKVLYFTPKTDKGFYKDDRELLYYPESVGK